MFGRDVQSEQRTDARSNGLAPRSPGSFSSHQNSAHNSGSRPADAEDKATSILGPDISIFGQQLIIKTKGSLLIQGQIQGDVHGEAVTVEDGANVTGVVTARTITIHGGAKGTLRGSSVVLHSTSIVDADIVHQMLSIDEGAQFEGGVRRAKNIGEVTPDLS